MTDADKKEFFDLLDELIELLVSKTDLSVKFITVLIDKWEKEHEADAVLSILVPAMTLAGKNINVKTVKVEED